LVLGVESFGPKSALTNSNLCIIFSNNKAPDSTLMLLVSAFLNDANGSKIPKIYEDAQANGYRFLSFGDVCMFSRPGK